MEEGQWKRRKRWRSIEGRRPLRTRKDEKWSILPAIHKWNTRRLVQGGESVDSVDKLWKSGKYDYVLSDLEYAQKCMCAGVYCV